jgi:hypothetical protein
MSWKYPEHPLTPGSVVGIDDINRSLSEFAEEVEGGLNEHNWKKDSFNRHDCSDDVAVEVWKVSCKQDHYADMQTDRQEWAPISGQNTWLLVQSDNNQTSINLTSSQCTLWIMSSFQVRRSGQADTRRGSVQFALRVNGVVIPETITGSTGFSYDAVHNQSLDISDPPLLDAPNDNNPHRDVTLGAGLSMEIYAVSVDAMIPVRAGSHTIELVARSTLTTAGESNVLTTNYFVASRDLTVIGLKA